MEMWGKLPIAKDKEKKKKQDSINAMKIIPGR